MIRKVVIQIKPHRDYPNSHVTAVVTLPSGLCYACTWAGEVGETEVVDTWRNDRRAFTPHNPVTGDY